MDIYAVLGEDAYFGGDHGLKEAEVITAENDEEALEYAKNLSWKVIKKYPRVYEGLEACVKKSCEMNDVEYGSGSEDEEQIRSEIYKEDVQYEAAILKVKKLPTLDLQELTNLLSEDEESFLIKYVKAYL